MSNMDRETKNVAAIGECMPGAIHRTVGMISKKIVITLQGMALIIWWIKCVGLNHAVFLHMRSTELTRAMRMEIVTQDLGPFF